MCPPFPEGQPDRIAGRSRPRGSAPQRSWPSGQSARAPRREPPGRVVAPARPARAPAIGLVRRRSRSTSSSSSRRQRARASSPGRAGARDLRPRAPDGILCVLSGRSDLNRGPHRPERCALPSCATPRTPLSMTTARAPLRRAARGGPARRPRAARAAGGPLSPARRPRSSSAPRAPSRASGTPLCALTPSACAHAASPRALDLDALREQVVDEIGRAVAERRADRVEARLRQRLQEQRRPSARGRYPCGSLPPVNAKPPPAPWPS